MCLSMWLIIFVIGTNKIGYAGVDSNILSLVKGIFRILKYSIRELEIITVLALLLIYYISRKDKKYMEYLLKLVLPTIFAFLIVMPNLILYAKSGMYYRPIWQPIMTTI